MVEFKTKMKHFIPHCVDMKWQQRDWRWVKRHFPRGTWACVQDFSENYTVEVAMEHQSKYYHNISVTLYGIIGYFHIDDLRDSFASAAKRNEMKDACISAGKAPIISVALVFIFNDLRRNQAFVQFVSDKAYDYVSTKSCCHARQQHMLGQTERLTIL
jgi:hypothetical protein